MTARPRPNRAARAAVALGTLGALAALAAPAPADAQRPPLLEFPERGVDDSAAYQGYRTRLFRDAARNTVQIYLDAREGRAVHLLADADDASVGFSARAGDGAPIALDWRAPTARVARAGRRRAIEQPLVARAPEVHLGAFLLGSMRVERDFQHWRHHRAPYADPPFVLEEHARMLAAMARLDAPTRARHLSMLRAADLAALRRRLRPTIATRRVGETWIARVVQPSLDARDTLALELRVDTRLVDATHAGDSLSLRARRGDVVPFTVRVETTGRALAPLAREEIFTPEFLAFLARTPERRLERQVRAVELLVSREKLMAGLPNYATYFGRDMLVSVLMMRDIWRPEMSEFAVAAALRKLSAEGEVSHEEALGGQAVREAAAEYAALVEAGDVARAGAVLAARRRTRENYHMVDDEYQLPVLAARWLADARVPAARKRAFLLDSSDGGGTRLRRLVAALGVVAERTAAYAAAPVVANLVAFPPRDTGWSSASWRDSGAGYANGRYPMDVNAIWVPHALESIGRILAAVRAVGLRADVLVAEHPALAAYARDAAALDRATRTWYAAERHFVVSLDSAAVRAHVAARVAAMPEVERAYWTARPETMAATRDSLAFLALALDADGRPIGVANTDPATGLFLGDREGGQAPLTAASMARTLRDVRPFARAYPAGLLVDRVGPVVANDAYAPPSVWQAFARDPYHGPRVVWGREVNLFLLGVASRIAAAGDTTGDAARAAYVRELGDAADRVRAAVEASGFHSELWSYEFPGGRLAPARYGTGSDAQLWSTTDLAVAYALSRARR